MSMPTAIATSPAGMPFGYLKPWNQLTMMMAKHVSPMIGVMYISSAGRMEMKVMENAGERAEQRRPRRDLADVGGDEAADHQDEALEEHPDQARLPALDRI